MLDIILTLENEEERSTAEWIWKHYERHMQKIASKILKNQCDVDDATMDAIECVVNSIRKFMGLGELDIVCLLTIYTKHAAFKIYNKNKAALGYVVDLEDTDVVDERVSVEDKIVSKPEYEKLAGHLETMPEIYSYPFLLRHYYGWSIREIMTGLDLTEATVKKRLNRAKQQLQNMMENPYE